MSLKLLVVEDNRAVADVVAYGARMVWPDCEVTIIESGAAALARFGRKRPTWWCSTSACRRRTGSRSASASGRRPTSRS